MFVNGKNISKLIEQQFPKYLAESWDNVGFMVGSPNARVEKVMMALELTPEVLDEAMEKNVDMIVVHHPLIFKPLKVVTDETEVGQMIKTLIQHKISLYAAHTNLDVGVGGTGDYLAEMLELERREPLEVTHKTAYVKLVVFVPQDHLEAVSEAMTSAGGGQIGNYDQCVFYAEGTGSFRPLEDSTPYIGIINEKSVVKESRLETLVSKADLKTVLTEMLKAHPYEVPAYDIIPLENEIEQFGIGVVGYLTDGMTFDDFVEELKNVLDLEQVKVVQATDRPIRKVAVCPGAGAEYIGKAAAMGCDVLVTGDVKYHDAQLAKSLRLSVIDAGHYETEVVYMAELARILRESCDHRGYEVKIIVSDVNANPFDVY